ncbi:hypothetical protein WJX82_004829 [Trebouxia sp. C0006]
MLRPGAGTLRQLVCHASSWPGKEGGTRQPVRSQLKAAARRLAYLWQSRIKTMPIGSVRTALAVAILMVGTLTAAANVWGVKRINHSSLSRVGPQASDLLGREVTVGQVNWLAPTGVTGLHPIASLGPVSVGPGATEGSWAHLPEVRVSLDPIKSLVQRKVVLKLHAPGAEVDLVQAGNLSWLGYPDDTIPSARNFLPGLTKGVETTNTNTAEGAELHQAAIEAYMRQAAARQAEKELQRQQTPAPPDAAVNFSPAVGKDLIREGLAKPRAKSKPAFASAAANPHPHPSHSHSVAHSLSPIPTQAPALNTPARARDDDADADEERRASGQAASTSGPSSKAPWDHPDPSAFPKSPSRGRGSPPSSPFASITMREPRSSSSLRSHAIPADGPVSQRSDPAPQERRCSVVSSDRVATQKRTGRRRHGSSSAQTAIRKIMDQVRAEEDQEGGQQHLGRHGGYMQRGGQERLPRRRTTRSLLRGADVQTGDPIDAGLAAYYASALPESELHPAWSLYHQQQAGALSPGTEPAAEAARAPVRHDADAHYSRDHQRQQQAAGSWSDAASQRRGIERDNGASMDQHNMQGSAEPIGREDMVVEPKYTPGVPPPPRGTLQISATADARLQRWIGQFGRASLSKVRMPEIALDSLAIKRSEVNAWVAGETVPRHFEQVDAVVQLARDYQGLEMHLSALAHERDPAQDKCTMLNSNATRNLRGATTAQQLSLQAVMPDVGSSPTESGLPGTPLGSEEGPQQADWGWRHHRQQRQRPTGGRFHIHATSDSLKKDAETFPDLLVTLKLQGLHAPLAERFVELPVDIAAGRLDGELKRLYMHNAIGMFGSIPLTLSGDVGINPDSGHYRLSGEVAGVEVNELRKTLGVRPTPYSVGGAVRGVLHVTGPLDQPIFSGTAVAAAPSKSMLDLSEDCNAKSTLVQTQGCVGAYDKMPLASASCLFTMDTSSDIFIMHSFQAEPVGGGKMLGSGRMWVAQAALDNPNAVKMSMRGQGLPTEALLKRYLPSGTVLPKALTLGPGEVQASMEGSHTNPTIQATWQVPVAQASGQVKLDKDSMHLSAKAPALDVSGILHMRPPPPEKTRAAVTQAEMTAVSVPVLEGAEVDANFKGLDVMPVVSPGTAENRPSLGQPTRLRLTGRTKLSGRLSPQPDQAVPSTQLPASAFEGDVLLDGLRVNQLKLSRNLTGSLQVSEKEVHMHAKGSRPDESLDMDLALPLFQPQPTPEPQQIKTQSMGGLLPGRLAGVADLLPVPRFAPSSLLPGSRKASTAGPPKPSAAPGMGEGGTFSLRCGQLSISAQVNASSSLVDAAVMGLKLDELELASLRGEVQEVSLSLNFDTRMGRGKVSVAGPRFSGLQGEALSGGVRWERDVIRLEKAVLQQRSSRYEVQGEYVIPPDTHIPDSAASMAPMELMGSRSGAPLKPPKSAFGQATGRWRLQVAVPQADMEEILPAARLLSRATAVTPSDYDRAKTLFLAGLHDAGMQAQSLVHQLEEAAKQARQQARNLQVAIPTSPQSALPSTAPEATAETGAGKGPSARGNVPGLQDLKGSWSGVFQAYGGGGGAANTDFDVKGADWQWGNYRMDQVVAIGSCHSNEGLKLEEVALRAEDAKLLLRGGLLGPHQNATLMLTDFPVALLQPLFRAVPALEHAAPAVSTSSEGLGLGASPGAPFHGLNMAFSRTGRAHALIPGDTLYSKSPVNGLLFVHGTIGGSASVPEGEIVVRLFEGAIGPTRLAQATATACLDSQQRLAFDCHLEPAQARQTGHVKLSGSLPLTFTDQPNTVEQSEPDDADWEETGDAAPEGSQETAPAPAPALGPQDVEAALHVKDAGMMLVSTVAPDFTWQSGNADIALRVSGQQEQPIIEGSAQLRKAAIYCPHFKYPMTNVHADINMANNHLQVEGLEARVGRRGHIKVRGGLPVTPSSTSASPAAPPVEPSGTDRGAAPEGINIAVQGLELRVRNVYTGHLDADLQLQQSLMQPEVGGVMRFSRGVAYLNPQGPSPTGQGSAEAGAQEADLVAQAFSALQARKEGAANGLVRQHSPLEGLQPAEVALVQPAVAERVVLQGLTIQLGPDLRTTYPVVMNFNISGQVDITGPADANKLQLQGTIKLDSGEVNLVATQLVLDREHTNRLVFVDGQGLDPNMDLKFRGPNLRALIQGPASSWQSHLTLTPTGGSGGEGTEQLDPSQAAKIFEGQLASALVAEDGQLALSNLAQSAAHAVMPKLQTQGQLGQARWRLVSAPSIPGLLSLDPIGDPTSLLSSLTMGTEVEVQFGKSLQATMARKLRDSDIATQWTLNYQLNTKLRMQFNISSSTPYPRTLVFQYSGEGGPRP